MDFFLPASSFQNLKDLKLQASRTTSLVEGSSHNLILLCNYLNGAAHFLNFFCCAFAELVRSDVKGVLQFPDT